MLEFKFCVYFLSCMYLSQYPKASRQRLSETKTLGFLITRLRRVISLKKSATACLIVQAKQGHKEQQQRFQGLSQHQQHSDTRELEDHSSAHLIAHCRSSSGEHLDARPQLQLSSVLSLCLVYPCSYLAPIPLSSAMSPLVRSSQSGRTDPLFSNPSKRLFSCLLFEEPRDRIRGSRTVLQ